MVIVYHHMIMLVVQQNLQFLISKFQININLKNSKKNL